MVQTQGMMVRGIIASLAVCIASMGQGQEFRAPQSVDVVAGEQLYGEFCASCHGMNLEGQPNWRVPDEEGVLPAPPHDPSGHTWHHGDALLFTYTKLGGAAALAAQGVVFKSGMPEFGQTLSDQEIWDILAYIKSTWPEDIRQAQANRSGG